MGVKSCAGKPGRNKPVLENRKGKFERCKERAIVLAIQWPDDPVADAPRRVCRRQ